jgi:hypothetical protein
MTAETHQPGAIGSKLSQMTGPSTNVPPIQTEQQCCHQLINRNGAIVATEIMTPNADFKMVRKTGHRNNMLQHATAFEETHINVDIGQLTI